METSPTHPLDNLVVGYPKLAGQMGLLPETAIFRRFGALNAQNLLYLQAELTYLEKQLRECERADNKSPKGLKSRYALDWLWLSRSAADGDEEQWELVKKIRATLKEYNTALTQQSTILGFSEPSKWDLNDIQHYLATKEMGPLALIGDDAMTWGSTRYPNSHCPDLVTIRPRNVEDTFSKWITEKIVPVFFRFGFGRLNRVPTVHGDIGYNDDSLLRITFWITTVVASLLPVASISILYCVHSILARLAIIAAFNVVVSVCLTGFTAAKRMDVFAVAAA
ncbi:uncharacterized protein K441DRAFT_559211 [Cenococcum geophilum 1.58]|uniref:uncharacterized protein n=1 Tax=Cenococcum geophilum 1.58 TaxID=794803 RepID=UPI00358E4251|nr:hypothetical protein K441DRAFT_559211 [Cenococcum geophilum 1.58]